MSQFFASGGQSIGTSASVLSMNIQEWFSLGLTHFITLQSKRISGVFSNTTVQKHQFFDYQLSLWSNSHIHTLLLEGEKKVLIKPAIDKAPSVWKSTLFFQDNSFIYRYEGQTLIMSWPLLSVGNSLCSWTSQLFANLTNIAASLLLLKSADSI